MNYDEFKQLCRKSKEEYNYQPIDRCKKKNDGRYCFCNEGKTAYIECVP